MGLVIIYSYLFLDRYDGKPEDVLNPKKKQLDKITPVGVITFLT